MEYLPRLTIRKYTSNLQEQKNNNQQTSMSSSKNESSSQKSSKGESGDGNFWDNNGGAIMSATSSVLHAGYRTTRYVAKAGYKAGKNHYEQSKNKRNGEEKSGSSESLETVQSPPMGASQDVRQFQTPTLGLLSRGIQTRDTCKQTFHSHWLGVFKILLLKLGQAARRFFSLYMALTDKSLDMLQCQAKLVLLSHQRQLQRIHKL